MFFESSVVVSYDTPVILTSVAFVPASGTVLGGKLVIVGVGSPKETVVTSDSVALKRPF